VLAAGLGYFVDAFDIALFSIVRVPSLQALGLSKDEILSQGVMLLNLQMAGMLVGGIAWGVLGDKLGRARVMFASILLYSVANILNGFVSSVEQYAVVRFVAGVGLAGEIGAGITLVSELLPKNIRGIGTTLVAVLGFLGVIAASLIGSSISWRAIYILGGCLGFLLLFLRMCVHESSMFERAKQGAGNQCGNLLLFLNRDRFKRLLLCVLVGAPTWVVSGVIVTLAPEISAALGNPEPISVGSLMLWYSIALAIGDLSSGFLSQILKSRKQVLATFLPLCGAGVGLTLVFGGHNSITYSALCSLTGFFVGYWAVLLTMSAEQFGINIRATAATSIPNFVRGTTIPITFAFTQLKPYLGVVGSVGAVSVCVFGLAIYALFSLRETYGVSLEFIETKNGVEPLRLGRDSDQSEQVQRECAKAVGA
jgi:MFS family permease